MKKQHLLIIYSALCGLAPVASPLSAQPAASTSSSARVAEHLSVWQRLDETAWTNPALHGDAFQTSLTQLEAAASYHHQNRAFVPELGRQSLLPHVKASTFLHLSPRTKVWGEASYMNGRTKDVRWNSTADFMLLVPYVIADTVGGETHRERYTFSGGYATRLGLLALGGEMLFRAEQEYRTRDPHMRSVVSDLTLRAGAAHPWHKYTAAIGAEANVYRQTNDVEFYSETGGVTEYQMTGLGTSYLRFSGTEADIYYQGGGAGLNLDLRRQQGSGAMAHVTLDEHRYRRVSSAHNSLPLTTLYRYHAGIEAGWRHRGHTEWAAWIQADYTKKSGDEHVAGAMSGGAYPVIADLTQYKAYYRDLSLHALYGRTAATTWHVGVVTGVDNQHQRYLYPLRRLDVSHLYASLSAQIIMSPTDRLTLEAALTATYRPHLDGTIAMPLADMQPFELRKQNEDYEMAKADFTTADAHIRADYALPHGSYALFAELGGGMTHCSPGRHDMRLRLALGVTF